MRSCSTAPRRRSSTRFGSSASCRSTRSRRWRRHSSSSSGAGSELRRRGARPAALGREEAVRVERVHLADRVAAARAGAHATAATQHAVRAPALEQGVPARERRLQAIRPPRARTLGADALARSPARVRPESRRAASLVGQPPGDADARDHARVRADRRGRAKKRPAPLGPRRALVPGRRDRVGARGGSRAGRAALPCAWRAAHEGRAGRRIPTRATSPCRNA